MKVDFFYRLIAAVIFFSPACGFSEKLPDLDKFYGTGSLSTPLRILTSDGKKLAEFGEKRQQPVIFREIPKAMIYAFVVAQDENFFSHNGVDTKKIFRALISPGRTRVGSTITVQLARMLFLAREKSSKRNLLEIQIAQKLEKKYSKQKILELYLNRIYLGQRTYGVAAAAKIYYNKSLKDLTLAQIAMIASLSGGPAKYNPILNPKRALLKRNYLLGRMKKLGYITKAQYHQARNEKISANLL